MKTRAKANRIAWFVIGVVLSSFDISLEIASDVLFVPGDGFARAIAVRFHADFGKVKVGFDVSLVIIAAILSLAFFSHIDGVGLGTIVSALAAGRLVTPFTCRVALARHVTWLKEAEPRTRQQSQDRTKRLFFLLLCFTAPYATTSKSVAALMPHPT